MRGSFKDGVIQLLHEDAKGLELHGISSENKSQVVTHWLSFPLGCGSCQIPTCILHGQSKLILAFSCATVSKT
jgi:hypothetical protein